MQKVDISVVVPFHNRKKYIKECIESIIKQDCTSVEILCIDDGSTDGSSEIVKEMQLVDDRIKLIYESQKGAAAARNIGIAKAKGRYVAFLDSDDFYLDNDILRKMVHACDENCVMVCGAKVFWYQNESLMEYYNEKCIQSIDYDEGDWISYLDFQSDRCHCGFIYNTEWLRKNGVLYPEYREYEDPVFFVHAMSCSDGFWFLPVNMLAIRVWDHGSDVRREQSILDILDGIKTNLGIAEKRKYNRLFDRIIRSINSEYRCAIVENMSDEILIQLFEINSMHKSLKSNNIAIVNDILIQIRNMNKYRFSDRHNMPIALMNMVDKCGIGTFQKYFEDKKIKRVIIYGLGNNGNAFYNIAIECGLQVVGLVDRNVISWDGIEVMRIEDSFPDADAVIVTMYEYGDVTKKLRQKVAIKVISFMELLNEIDYCVGKV